MKKSTTITICIFSFVIISLIIMLSITISYYKTSAPLKNVVGDGFTFEKQDDNTYAIVSYNGTNEEINIPIKVRGLPITKIDSKAFKNNKNIKYFTVHSDIKTIEKGILEGCTNIKELRIPYVGETANHEGNLQYFFTSSNIDNKNGTYVPASLKTVYITGKCNIGINAFRNCKNLEKVYLNKNIKEIDDGTRYTTIGVNGHMPEDTKYKQMPFFGCSPKLTVYCEIDKKPDEWGDYWKFVFQGTTLNVVWDYKNNKR